MIQFVSQGVPASDEYACSHRAEVAVICDQMNRMRTAVPFTENRLNSSHRQW
jgi:hypothetical protein